MCAGPSGWPGRRRVPDCCCSAPAGGPGQARPRKAAQGQATRHWRQWNEWDCCAMNGRAWQLASKIITHFYRPPSGRPPAPASAPPQAPRKGQPGAGRAVDWKRILITQLGGGPICIRERRRRICPFGLFGRRESITLQPPLGVGARAAPADKKYHCFSSPARPTRIDGAPGRWADGPTGRRKP